MPLFLGVCLLFLRTIICGPLLLIGSLSDVERLPSRGAVTSFLGFSPQPPVIVYPNFYSFFSFLGSETLSPLKRQQPCPFSESVRLNRVHFTLPAGGFPLHLKVLPLPAL